MSVIRREWLLHGCLNVGALPRDERPSTDLNERIGREYGADRFRVRGWPGRGFKDILWWSERDIPLRRAAAYTLRLDRAKGPALYAGITVEKGFEDRSVAKKRAKELGEPVDQLLLSKDWDWFRALDSFPTIGTIIQASVRRLGVPIYGWVKFSGGESEYFTITDDALYRRGGFKPVHWRSVVEFASAPNPQRWGRLSLMRAFSLDECTPALDASAIMTVFNALRPVRDAWHGLT